MASAPKTAYVPAVNLAARRFERLEKSQQETNDTLARVATILEAHSRHFVRMEEAMIGISERFDGMSERIDRLTAAIARGRTRDLAQLDDHELRLQSLETKSRRKKR